MQPSYCDCLQPTVHPLSKIWPSSSHVLPLMRHGTSLNEALTTGTGFHGVTDDKILTQLELHGHMSQAASSSS
jgi:hypothetical protein